MIFNRISFQSRLLILAAIIFLLWLFTGLLVNDQIRSLAGKKPLLFSAGRLTTLILESENSILKSHPEEAPRGTVKSPSSVNADIDRQIRLLRNNTCLMNYPGLLQSLDIIAQRNQSVRQAYPELADILQERGSGFSGQSGLVLEQLSSLSDSLGKGGIPAKSIHWIYSWSGSIRDYLAHPSPAKFHQIHATFKTNMPALTAATGHNNPMIANMIRTLMAGVQTLYQLDRKIGFSKNQGLHGKIFRELGIMEEESREISGTLQEDIRRSLTGTYGKIMITLVLTALLFVLILVLFFRSFSRPLNDLRNHLRKLSQGILPETLTPPGRDEISEIQTCLNGFVGSLKEKAEFAGKIKEGKNVEAFDPLGEHDVLGNALLTMGNSLQQAKREDETRKIESEKRRWTNEGIARFEELLRIHSNHLDALCDNLIKDLVKYLDAAQGCIFLAESSVIRMQSAFAYGRKKYIEKSFKPGEGLPGTCYIEKSPIYITEIPDDYTDITSGLGTARPKSIFLVPLSSKDEVLGVMEIASLQTLTDHEREFVIKLAGSISSTISNVKMNMRTARLLEESRQHAREMAEHEEKMKKSMENLRSAQVVTDKREMEIESILNAINDSSLVAEYNMNEELTGINDKFLMLLETNKDAVIGKKHYEILSIPKHNSACRKLWDDLKAGKSVSNEEQIRLLTGNVIWLRQTFNPIPDNKGRPVKILHIAYDITVMKKQKESLQQQAGEIARKNNEMTFLNHAIDEALVKCELSPAGHFLDVNLNYERATGYTKKELIGKNYRTFLQKSEKDHFEKIWSGVIKGKAYNGVIRRTKPTGEEVWIMANFTPATDETGNLIKVYFLGQDITERKLKYQLLEEANREIDRLRKAIRAEQKD